MYSIAFINLIELLRFCVFFISFGKVFSIFSKNLLFPLILKIHCIISFQDNKLLNIFPVYICVVFFIPDVHKLCSSYIFLNIGPLFYTFIVEICMFFMKSTNFLGLSIWSKSFLQFLIYWQSYHLWIMSFTSFFLICIFFMASFNFIALEFSVWC